jgi:NAD(P)H-flavin reductase
MMNAALATDPFVPQIWRVASALREAPDTTTLDLVPVDGAPLSFLPGQFNMLYAFGVGEIAVSMSGNPSGRDRFVHTIRAVGAVSSRIAALKLGEAVGLRGPYGTAWPMAAARGRDVVLVAGGLGLAPLRPAIYEILANREAHRRVVILIGMRNPAGILYRHEIEQWRESLDIEIEVTVDHADDRWRGNVGVVPSLIARMGFDSANVVAMVCGPEIMMRFATNALRDRGVAPERIYLSMERNMKCAIGLCGHCQFGPDFICKDGPVMRFDRISEIFAVREL